jgi:hypothetical protein
LAAHRTARALSLGAALTLLPASATAAPSGDEYLPKVPKAAGKEVLADPQPEAGGSVLAPEIRGAPSTDSNDSSQPSESSESPAKAKKPAEDKSKSKESNDLAIAPADSDSDDNSSGGTVVNPIILLVIAGVVAAAAGMTLRRRRADEQPGAEKGHGGPAEPHPTPDGEIVAGGDEAA